ncbi:hypothetical protein CRUP_016670 [Coryphaenoides rupestris]|nr:hypothetical protein CRUP_016670 [Coryphaenoides rupestris]
MEAAAAASHSISIFTLKEVQLQRDPGYRSSSYPESEEKDLLAVKSRRTADGYVTEMDIVVPGL